MHIAWSIRLVGVLSVLLSLTGCKKKENIVVRGEVYEGHTDHPIPGVLLRLDFNELSGGSYSAGYKALAEGVSDGSGDFTFDFDRVQAVNYRVSATKEGFEEKVFIIGGDEWTIEGDNRLHLELHEIATLDIRFHNAAPVTNSDQVLFRLLSHSEGCTDCCQTNTYSIQGADTAIRCKVYAHQVIGYEYTRIGPESSESKTGEISISPGPENVIEIDF